MRTTWAVGLALLCFSCGGGDRLAAGTEAMVDAATKGRHSTLASELGGKADFGSVSDGTKVRVIADDAGEEFRAGEPDAEDRPVKVNILEGEHAGKTATIPRRDLKPIR